MMNEYEHPSEQTDRELTTSDLAAAAERATEEHRDDREVPRAVERDVTRDRAARADASQATPALLADDVVDGFRSRWSDAQAGFVDEPRRAVEQADALVADAIKHLAESFARERANLEQQWDRGGDVSTEDLRQALQRYRAFFTRLLSV